VSGSGDRAGSVQKNGGPSPAFLAREDRVDRRRVLLGRAAAQLAGVAARDAEVEWVDLTLVHGALDDFANEVRPGGRELVDPAGAVDDEGPAGTELREHLRDRPHQGWSVDADHLRPRAGRVRERAKHVEDRAGRELAPDRSGVPHRRVVGGREQEAEAELVDRVLDPLGRQLEPEAERLEHVGRAGGRGDRAVAMLRDSGAGRSREQRRCGRDVDRALPVAARSGGVDEVVPLRPHGQHVGAHGLGAARDLVRCLALQAQRD